MRCLGVHSRSAHPVEYHKQAIEKMKGKVTVKKRWDAVEVSRMALKEAEITKEHGNVENINQLLNESFPDRTTEAIKGKRRPEIYKKDGKRTVGIKDQSSEASSEEEASPPPPHSIPDAPNGETTKDLPSFSPIPEVSVEREDTEFNMINETIIYTSIETLFNEVNTNQRIRGVPDETISILIHIEGRIW